MFSLLRGCSSAFPRNLKKLVTGYMDCRVVVWDTDSGCKLDRSLESGTVARRFLRWACFIIRVHWAKNHACVAISGDGRTAVLGWRHGRVYIDMHNDEAVMMRERNGTR